MKAVVQVVRSAEVTAASGEQIAAISQGLCVLVGVGRSDTVATAGKLAEKLANARLLPADGKLWSSSVKDADAELLLVSNFTLYGDLSKGRRPSWNLAMPPVEAEPIYTAVVDALRALDVKVSTGSYGDEMTVTLANWGPSTIVLEVED